MLFEPGFRQLVYREETVEFLCSICLQQPVPHFPEAFHMMNAFLHSVVHLLFGSEAANAEPKRTQESSLPDARVGLVFFLGQHSVRTY